MALAVWILYAGDRLLDAAKGPATQLEARHHFHHLHRRAFVIGIAVATLVLAVMLPRLNPTALRLYLIEGALLAVWFLAVHSNLLGQRLPKEMAVGIFFAAAVFIPTVSRAPALRVMLLPLAILLASVFILNCVFIYAWEHRSPIARLQAHVCTRFAVSHLHAISVALIVMAGSIAPLVGGAVPVACSLAVSSLLALDRKRCVLAPTSLRAAADLALLTPLLVALFIR